jgi:MFS family permease
MVLSDILMLIVIALQMVSLNIYFLIATHLVQGMLIGVSSIVIPTYLMSISPTKISGKIGSLNQILITIGIALGYAMGYRINDEDLGNFYNWRICVSVPAVMCCVRIVACCLLPMDTI